MIRGSKRGGREMMNIVETYQHPTARLGAPHISGFSKTVRRGKRKDEMLHQNGKQNQQGEAGTRWNEGDESTPFKDHRESTLRFF